MSVNNAAANISFLLPNGSPSHTHDREPVRAPSTKVATTTPWIVAFCDLTVPVVFVVSICGKVFAVHAISSHC